MFRGSVLELQSNRFFKVCFQTVSLHLVGIGPVTDLALSGKPERAGGSGMQGC